jgi:hypothetical protein
LGTRTLKWFNSLIADFLDRLASRSIDRRSTFGPFSAADSKNASIFNPGKFPPIRADRQKREIISVRFSGLATCASSAFTRFSGCIFLSIFIVPREAVSPTKATHRVRPQRQKILSNLVRKILAAQHQKREKNAEKNVCARKGEKYRRKLKVEHLMQSMR